jgi:hypothetical protein
MVAIVDYRLPDLTADPREFFLTSLSDRFERMNPLWQGALARRYGRPFVPIHVLRGRQNQALMRHKPYYLVVARAPAPGESASRFYQYDDLNEQLCGSSLVNELIDRLAARQGVVYVLGFTTVYLHFHDPRVRVLGPDPALAERYDDKGEQFRLFERLGVPTAPVVVLGSLEEVRLRLSPGTRYLLSASRNTGGIESRVVDSPADLNGLAERLRPRNRGGPFILQTFLSNVVCSPNTTAIASGGGRVDVISVADQLLDGICYVGNVWPSRALPGSQAQAVDITRAVGTHLAQEGYRGLFGMDFIVDDAGRVMAVDLNPRRQGGYLCNTLWLRRHGVSLTDVELAVSVADAGGLEVPSGDPGFAWAHARLANTAGSFITRTGEQNRPDTPFLAPGGTYRAVYYPVGCPVAATVGYVIASAAAPEQAELSVSRLREEATRSCFGIPPFRARAACARSTGHWRPRRSLAPG